MAKPTAKSKKSETASDTDFLKIEMVETEKVVPNERNEKKHTEQQIHRIARSIRKFGFVQPLLVDGNNRLIIGHARLAAARRLGMDTVPYTHLTLPTNREVRR
jgi:ParB-like chromosome segregation protein Spo0J